MNKKEFLNSLEKKLSVLDDKEKQDIIEQIQNIFDGKIKVEDLLDSTDITFDNSQSCKLIKKHLW